jgi:hypothetical protein
MHRFLEIPGHLVFQQPHHLVKQIVKVEDFALDFEANTSFNDLLKDSHFSDWQRTPLMIRGQPLKFSLIFRVHFRFSGHLFISYLSRLVDPLLPFFLALKADLATHLLNCIQFSLFLQAILLVLHNFISEPSDLPVYAAIITFLGVLAHPVRLGVSAEAA